MEIITKHNLLDELLQQWQTALKTDMTAYRNHCYRVLNFYAAFVVKSPENLNKGAIAIAFHDLGIWTQGTLDYLPPSIELAKNYLLATERGAWVDEISAMIENHHKITPYPQQMLVEALRKADWLDVSLGMIHFGIHRDFINAIQKTFPNAGFHAMLVRLSVKNSLKHPFKPLPMFKW